MINLDEIRREYSLNKLDIDNIKRDPFEQFTLWMNEAVATGMPDPTAMVLATVSKSGAPSQRIVLLKKMTQKGFIFFTNYTSNKAEQIAGEPQVCLHFPWHIIERQVIIKGRASKISLKETAEYFLSRPLDSQLGAWASRQSQPISSRAVLLQQFNAMKEKFAKGRVPVPDFWGGYEVEPYEIEFWQGGNHRLHDRFIYTKTEAETKQPQWQLKRVQP